MFQAIPPITSVLLTLPKLGNPYLSQASYSILSDLLTSSVNSGTRSGTEQIPAVLAAILASPPLKSDVTVAPSWLRVLGDTMLAYHSADAEGCAAEFLTVWKAIWAFFDSTHAQTRKAVADAIASLAQCTTLTMVQAAAREPENGKSALRSVLAQTSKALDSLAYAQAVPELLSIISSLIRNLDMRVKVGELTTAAETFLMPLVQQVAELRVQKNFEHKEAADVVVSTAMRVVGPAVLLQALPLNLEPEDRFVYSLAHSFGADQHHRQAGREPRAFLLPMLAQPHPSPLSHFVSYFVPLSERMFDRQQKADAEGRQSEAKVWSVLVSQVWAGFAGYCNASPDVKSVSVFRLTSVTQI